MTDGTQELDEILGQGYRYEGHEFVIDTPYLKQAILDWHNKQIEEVLDRLAVEVQASDYIGIAEAIEAEHNKLKESSIC